MKKLIACAVLIGATCAFAEDSYLYWMIDPAGKIYDGGTQTSLPTEPGSIGVKISAFAKGSAWVYGGAESYLTIYPWSGGTVGESPIGGGDQLAPVSYGSQYFAAIPTDGVDWTYYVELYNDSSIFARSDMPYTVESIAALSGMGRPGTLWNVKAFVPAAVPEPNSALLMLIGCAALALRRRKQIAA